MFVWITAQWENFVHVGKTLFLGWVLHYLPFGIMGRVTYLHHYFPALYFSILMVPFLLDHFTLRSSSLVKNIVFGVAFTLVVGVFFYFAPVAFGFAGPASQMKGRKWLQSWNIVD